jgi:hypothetical protein
MATNEINSSKLNQTNENATHNAKVAAAHTMLLSAVSPSLQALSRCIEERNWDDVVTRKFVNEIAHDKVTEKPKLSSKRGSMCMKSSSLEVVARCHSRNQSRVPRPK